MSRKPKTLLVTGGAGFIGSNFVLQAVAAGDVVVNLDTLTYAGNLENLASVVDNPRHFFVQGNIADAALVAKLLSEHQPDAIVHFAAESHVDRSILGPEIFLKTNVLGTFTLLQAALAHWNALSGDAKDSFRFLHVSTDEVYGSLAPAEAAFHEDTPYQRQQSLRQLRRPVPTTWSGRGFIPTDCPFSPPTVPTITVLTSSLKS